MTGAEVANPNFSLGLASWETSGTVDGSGGIGVLVDNSAPRSLLHQAVAAAPGAFTLSFDFRNALSESVPIGALADTFFASIYFANDLGTLDVAGGVFDRAISLFDLDATGASAVTGTIGASSKGADWSLFALTFTNTHGFIVPVFDLRELNFTNGDSAVAVDNVVLVAAPEITAQPQSIAVVPGEDATLAIGVTSGKPVTFQWQRNGIDLPGATEAELTLESLLPVDSGVFQVITRDDISVVTSAPAFVLVLRIESVEKSAAGATLRFLSVAGAAYDVEMTANLASNVWTPLATGIVGTGDEMSVPHVAAATLNSMYYRLRVGSVASAPAGFFTINVRRKSQFPVALPFATKAEEVGRVSSATGATITDLAAGWPAGAWTAAPHCVRIVSGAANGRYFRILNHTSTQLTVDAPLENLATVLAPGDRYEIALLPTFANVFGADGGVLAKSVKTSRADLVRLFVGKRFIVYYHDGTNWRLARSLVPQNDTVILPDHGVNVLRRNRKIDLPLVFTGEVPITARSTNFNGRAKTFAANRFPVDLTLLASGLASLPMFDRRKDSVQVWDLLRRRFLTHKFNGVEWRRSGSRANANNTPIPAGTAYFVTRKSKTLTAPARITQEPPFETQP